MYRKFALNKTHLLNAIENVNFRRNYHAESVFGYRQHRPIEFQVSEQDLKSRNEQSNFYRFVTAYREHAHKCADLNPVALNNTKSSILHLAELNPNRYGFNHEDKVSFKGILNIPGQNEGTVRDAMDYLNEVYAKTISAEFLYMETEQEREWFAQKLEAIPNEPLDNETKLKIATELLKSQAFDRFLGNKFTSLKRYGGEGAESMMVFFHEFFKLSIEDGQIEEIVLAMPHRGRLNLLTGLLNMPASKLFHKLKGLPDFPEHYRATGDVISHLISSTDIKMDDKSVHVTMVYNPSHLEAANPVSMGKTRAKQLQVLDGDYNPLGTQRWADKILNILVHGDAALPGQGINAECLALSSVPHFEIGGSIHLAVNNQVGFTTPATRSRSSRYCTDLAKIINAPVIHVNGDDPEMVVKATQLAFQYQRQFRKDVFVDLNCYRQWGHNEVDDPTLTNPTLYNIIQSRRTVPDLYTDKLVEENIISKASVDEIVRNYTESLNNELKNMDNYMPEDSYFKKHWSGLEQAPEAVTTWNTGVNRDLLTFIGIQSVAYPDNFNIHSNVLRAHVQSRIKKIADGTTIDWPTAEVMAFGTLIHEGYNVRISGQDVGRGTFAHRNVMLVDQKSNNIYIPLNNISPDQKAHFEVANSILSEEAVLGFEYGMSVENPNNLIIWEAQFGDFFNGAQIIFDTFISSGETKWLWSSAITILLPHGYDGAGPEHSSCRLERFLQMTDSNETKIDGDHVNMHIAQPSTPAQYFHLLRRQMIRNFRKPLIIIAPKTLLRLSAAVSSLEDMSPGSHFLPVISDPQQPDPQQVQKVILCSGKHYYNLNEKRKQLGLTDQIALVRLESFCPFPTLQLQEELEKYTKAKYFVWSQEEPRNMGAWNFIKPRFENLLGKRLRYAGRESLAAPAVGVAKWHEDQAQYVINHPFNI